MHRQDLDQRLSRISTQWTMVLQAHGPEAEASPSALHRLLERYSGAAFRYLLGALRDADAAEELAQEFALRIVRGDFRRASPERGRFRDYLKTALINMVTDYHRREQGQPRQLEVEPAAVALADQLCESTFRASWREELLERTWKSLLLAHAGYHAVLQFRIANPDAISAQMAEHLSASMGKPVSAASARKMLERGHAKFAELMVEEVAISLEDPSPEELEEELNELDLLRYCRSALRRRNS
jgi:RNA polymerase sigma factor (sigma-70 family)